MEIWDLYTKHREKREKSISEERKSRRDIIIWLFMCGYEIKKENT